MTQIVNKAANYSICMWTQFFANDTLCVCVHIYALCLLAGHYTEKSSFSNGIFVYVSAYVPACVCVDVSVYLNFSFSLCTLCKNVSLPEKFVSKSRTATSAVMLYTYSLNVTHFHNFYDFLFLYTHQFVRGRSVGGLSVDIVYKRWCSFLFFFHPLAITTCCTSVRPSHKHNDRSFSLTA